MQDFQNQLKYYQNIENCSIFSNVTFHFWKLCVWGPEKPNVAIIAIKQLIFKNEKSHVKKLNSFQCFGNILTDSESLAFQIFSTGLTKGQTKLKWFFQADNSSKKGTNEFDFTIMIPQVDLFLFVFWKKLKTPKTFRN